MTLLALLSNPVADCPPPVLPRLKSEEEAAALHKMYEGHFLRNGLRRKDGYRPNYCYKLQVHVYEDGVRIIFPYPHTPGPEGHYPNEAAFKRYFDYWSKAEAATPAFQEIPQ